MTPPAVRARRAPARMAVLGSARYTTVTSQRWDDASGGQGAPGPRPDGSLGNRPTAHGRRRWDDASGGQGARHCTGPRPDGRRRGRPARWPADSDAEASGGRGYSTSPDCGQWCRPGRPAACRRPAQARPAGPCKYWGRRFAGAAGPGRPARPGPARKYRGPRRDRRRVRSGAAPVAEVDRFSPGRGEAATGDPALPPPQTAIRPTGPGDRPSLLGGGHWGWMAMPVLGATGWAASPWRLGYRRACASGAHGPAGRAGGRRWARGAEHFFIIPSWRDAGLQGRWA